MDTRPDSSQVDVLVGQLGEEIMRDPFYESESWDQLALVINLHQRSQMFGYIYGADDWEAAGPDGSEPLETARRLRTAMHEQNGVIWRRCLVTIDRRTARLDIHFDYEGTMWVPDAADPERFALSLKPPMR
jgi:hypothetical protein